MRRPRWIGATLLGVAALFAASCMTATDVEQLEITSVGSVVGQAFIDLNGNGQADAGDQPLRGGSVELVASGTSAVVTSATTDSLGVFTVPDVPFGVYDVRLSAAILGDSLTALSTGGAITVQLGAPTVVGPVGASYPHLSLEDVLTATPGTRVFTTAIALNGRPNNGDGLVFFKGASGYLRGTNVERTTVTAGDSVRILGRVATSHGRPALDAVTPFLLVSSAQLVLPVDVGVPGAEEADGGALDAALVRISGAEIRDTTSVGNDKHFWAHAEGDSVEVVLRAFLFSPMPSIRPDTVMALGQAVGMLSPFDDGSGNVRWRLLVRSASDLATVIKTADVAITSAFDTLQASIGDTVEIRVTARNVAGSHTATNVTVTDTIPAALAYVSSTATRGSYDPATRTWTIGNLAVGAPADTLRIRVEVVGPAGNVTNIARLQPLTREFEQQSGNDVGTAFPLLGIS